AQLGEQVGLADLRATDAVGAGQVGRQGRQDGRVGLLLQGLGVAPGQGGGGGQQTADDVEAVDGGGAEGEQAGAGGGGPAGQGSQGQRAARRRGVRGQPVEHGGGAAAGVVGGQRRQPLQHRLGQRPRGVAEPLQPGGGDQVAAAPRRLAGVA